MTQEQPVNALHPANAITSDTSFEPHEDPTEPNTIRRMIS
jgi:hypothetical protein